MGLTPYQVAQSMATCGVPVHPDFIDAWESGSHIPAETELFALADVLWCPVATLMGLEPQTLRELRLARQLTAERLALRIGMDLDVYTYAEENETWDGDYRQTRALADALGLTLRQLVSVIGQSDELGGLLRSAIEGRWKAYVGPVSQIVTVNETRVSDVLRALHAEYSDFSERYMGHLVARNDDARLREIAAERSAFLRNLVDHFWELVGEAGEAAPFSSHTR
ncbi:transcriptional regulator [Streptomyces meridianus]|uniref:Transcriptional regulator n=1 Tax=Streptomyces meridianus TaxID=2938945 RepID=A0ABT0X9Y8_9ACTN|nr:transcriptional regulator [Streptomyces meridianus]MCM2579343.1 transcriptional regulator [Streptomyces meridianus]